MTTQMDSDEDQVLLARKDILETVQKKLGEAQQIHAVETKRRLTMLPYWTEVVRLHEVMVNALAEAIEQTDHHDAD